MCKLRDIVYISHKQQRLSKPVHPPQMDQRITAIYSVSKYFTGAELTQERLILFSWEILVFFSFGKICLRGC